jgi:hypothetical protein
METRSQRTGARACLATLALLLWLAPAAGAVPTHPPLSVLDIAGLNHACGAAVDSQGDVYVSSAGESKIEVYSEAHAELTSISNIHEPCGLAVDSNGNLYVSEEATGEVVKYHPTTPFPFVGTPSYESPTTIDASGNAKGIAVELTDDSLYVAEGSRVTIYKSDGALFTNNEIQALEFTGSPSGGTYTLEFKGSKTAAIPYNAPSNEPGGAVDSVQEYLEALPAIGAGNVAVAGNSTKVITFVGALAATNVPQLVVDPSALVGGSAEIKTRLDGFDGHLEGGLANATGVASYTSQASSNFNKRRYVSIADAGADEIKVFVGRLENEPVGFVPGSLGLRAAIDGNETPAGELGLATGGAYLGVDSKNGHVFAYDAAHKVLNELEATGPYFTRIVDGEFADAEPTAIAVDRSGGANEGTVYVSVGASAGAKLLAFGPVQPPGRQSLEPPHLPHSFNFAGACGDAVDSEGDLYVAGESVIRVYDPAGNELTSISDPAKPCWLAVDSEGNLYAANLGTTSSGDEKVVRYEPNAYPFSGIPTYTEKATIETLNGPTGVAVDLQDDHLFVTHGGAPGVIEYKSAQEGSGLLVSGFCGFAVETGGIDVYRANGDVYIANSREIAICDSTGAKVLGRIDGSGSPAGVFGIGTMNRTSIAVDQANGHVVVGEMETRGVVEEYEASGAFVAQYGSFVQVPGVRSDLAIDRSGKPTHGNLYVAYDAPTGFDLTAFGPPAYGEPPVALTGTVSGIGGGNATLNGTVEPRSGVELTECRFEYILDTQYISNGETFAGAESKDCAEGFSEIGTNAEPVPVHADVVGLDPEERYRFRLVAANKFGSAEGEARLFGPPSATTASAQPIFYHEATLRGKVDPSGLATEYRFEYVDQQGFEEQGGFAGPHTQSTPLEELPPGEEEVAVEAPILGLAEGTVYHFRLRAKNEAGSDVGLEKQFETLTNPSASCPNAQLRTGPSAALPDCRAYELVTPAQTNGIKPLWPVSDAVNGNFKTDLAAADGESAIFMTGGTLPGTEGNGIDDAHLAVRGPHGWTDTLFSPSGAQTDLPTPGGVSTDLRYSFWTTFGDHGSLDLAGASRHYIRRLGGVIEPGCSPEPQGNFEFVGCGEFSDPAARGRWIGPGAAHVIFTSSKPLEPDAPIEGTEAIYDRTPDGTTHVLSLLPGGGTPSAPASYRGTSADGGSVAFTITEGGVSRLYEHREGEGTLEVASGPTAFAGLSSDGSSLFYVKEGGPEPGLYDYLAGSGSKKIAGAGAAFVNVSADGSRAYFSSEEDLTPAQPPNENGETATVSEHNLYVWDAASEALSFVAVLADSDVTEFNGTASVNLVKWTSGLSPNASGLLSGPAIDPSRSTPDGQVLVFESHADLTEYEAAGYTEVYRYDAGDGSLACVSCSPTDAPAESDAELGPFNVVESPISSLNPLVNVTDDGNEVFFESSDRLLPGDLNAARDVYGWREGRIALISSGKGLANSMLFAMTPDGRNVFFTTTDALVPEDEEGGISSLYDARVEGGFPAGEESPACQGEACQPPSGGQPALPVPASAGLRAEEAEPPVRCPKGTRKVRKAGKTRCVKPHKHRARHKRRRHRGRGGR